MAVSIPVMVSVGEGDGMVTVCATLSAVENTERSIMILIYTANETGNSMLIDLLDDNYR